MDLLGNLPSPHPRAPTRPSTLEVLRVREHAPSPSPSTIFTFGLVVKSLKELGGVLVALSYTQPLVTLITTFGHTVCCNQHMWEGL
jgi:hypothetical protein